VRDIAGNRHPVATITHTQKNRTAPPVVASAALAFAIIGSFQAMWRDLYKGGAAKGNTCVPAGADGLWTVSIGLGDKPVFFAAK
jgi:hypothetical protein